MHTFYEAFISSSALRQSPAWLQELAASGFRCRLCNAGGVTVRLEVHHRTYARLGQELADDLTTLCTTCHWVVTNYLHRQRYRDWRPRLGDVQRLVARVLVDSNEAA